MVKPINFKIWIRTFVFFLVALIVILGTVFLNDFLRDDSDTVEDNIPPPYGEGPSEPPSSIGPGAGPPMS